MAGEWQKATLRAADVTLIDCDHRTPPAADSGYPYLAIPQLHDGRLDLGEARRISREHFLEWTRKAKPFANDVVLSRRCNPGETAVVSRDVEFALGQNLVLLRASGRVVYPPFLRWLVRSPDWWGQVGRFINVGAVFDSLKCADIPKFELPIPPLDDQRAIAHVLGTLDDKIELNRRMNETLEAMARALFKSWFVDFDPVHTKARGGSLNLSPAVAGLFPSEFELSPLGPIPSGWQATRWGTLVTLEYGKSLSEYSGGAGTFPVFGTNGRIGSHNELLCKHAGVIIGRKGAYRGVHYCNSPFFVIDTAFYVEPIVPLELRWAYYELLRQDINSMDSGSAIPSTSREDFYSIPVVAPPADVQNAFVQLLAPCWHRQDANDREANVLAALRDTLLPKLITGELRVKAAEKIVEAVA